METATRPSCAVVCGCDVLVERADEQTILVQGVKVLDEENDLIIADMADRDEEDVTCTQGLGLEDLIVDGLMGRLQQEQSPTFVTTEQFPWERTTAASSTGDTGSVYTRDADELSL